jgi:hypothetical protein
LPSLQRPGADCARGWAWWLRSSWPPQQRALAPSAGQVITCAENHQGEADLGAESWLHELEVGDGEPSTGHQEPFAGIAITIAESDQGDADLGAGNRLHELEVGDGEPSTGHQEPLAGMTIAIAEIRPGGARAVPVSCMSGSSRWTNSCVGPFHAARCCVQ